MILARNRNVFSKKIKGRWTLLKNKGKEARQLNDTAGFIWELLEKKQSIEALVREVVKTYSVRKDKAKKDVEKFVGKFTKENFITQSK